MSSIVIADDYDLARAGLRAVLAEEGGVDVVGEAADGLTAVALCRRLKPDLVLMDVNMPELDGLAATRIIKQDCPGTRVIIVTMHDDPDHLLEALKAGATGYLLKSAPWRDVTAAVRTVLDGESLLNPAVATALLSRLAKEQTRAVSRAPTAPLTARELDVLRLVVEGQTNREIGATLTISLATVKTHVERIIAKLEVSDRTQAAVRAIELHLIVLESR